MGTLGFVKTGKIGMEPALGSGGSAQSLPAGGGDRAPRAGQRGVGVGRSCLGNWCARCDVQGHLEVIVLRLQDPTLCFQSSVACEKFRQKLTCVSGVRSAPPPQPLPAGWELLPRHRPGPLLEGCRTGGGDVNAFPLAQRTHSRVCLFQEERWPQISFISLRHPEFPP